ncbi:N-acylglucosamine 2-epimerase [Bremerella cremea]|uniref:N-acylglucosamine 2-epimerase n=1 Tax=Bremerella cremea TaxID=1031537 RepID=A0A368KWV4_9BACT|nr:AGE family epimerase/isomerase [Bremerella cremea]RCS54127.1 N-acylglucosamine 2-epimerase [Bremerella cremea]
MNEARRSELLATYRDGLLHDTLPFWLSHGVDHQHGGIITSLNRDGSIIDTDKGVWQQGRFAWLLGELYNQVEQRPEWLDMARHTIIFLNQHGFDPSDGRMWFHLTREGQPIRKRRYAFSEAFAAIAMGELAQATGSEQLAKQAQALFLRFVRHNPMPKFTDVRPTRGIGVPMITINAAQQLRDSIELPEANDFIDHSIDAIRRYHVHEDIACVMETVGPAGERLDHFDGRTLNPGHAIEGAWFIMWEGQYRQDAELIALGCRMLDWMWQRGWDQQYGGMLYFVDVAGLPVQEYWHDMKFWWPQNETIIATLLAHAVTGEAKYETWHQQAHEWAYQHFADSTHGEWFGYLHRDGSHSTSLKGNLWKGPFHLPRMQLTCWKILETLVPSS